jgi:hypothetical protein
VRSKSPDAENVHVPASYVAKIERSVTVYNKRRWFTKMRRQQSDKGAAAVEATPVDPHSLSSPDEPSTPPRTIELGVVYR